MERLPVQKAFDCGRPAIGVFSWREVAMHHFSLSACTLALAACLIAVPAASSAAPVSKQPKVSVKCLAPGSSRPVACATLSPDTMLSLQLGRGENAPQSLIIRNVGTAKTVRIQPKWSSGDSLETRVKVPASLCEGARSGQKLQFEIQTMTSDLQTADSVGYFQMRCD